MKIRLLTAAAICAFAFNALAVDAPPPPTTDLATAVSGKYTLDPNHTSITFKVLHMGLSNYTGRFNKVSGDMNFDAKEPAKSTLNVSIDPTSVDVNHPKLNEEISTQDVNLDSAKYPAITFVSKSVTKLSDTQGTVLGDLTLHGVTKPVTLNVSFIGHGINPMSKKPMLGFSATGAIKRSDFGMTSWAPFVGDDVKIQIETEFAGE